MAGAPQPGELSFRIAGEGDFDFVWEGRVDIAKADDYTIPDVKKDKERALSAIREGKLLLALIGGKPVAFAWFSISDKTPFGAGYGPFGRKYAFVDYVYVHPEFRRLGIGKKLYDELGKRCKEEGIKEIILDVLELNERSKEFHKKAGFEPFVTLYSKRL
ncbi:GNAT family N-acetyltransferase [Candidatus Micrarchaeota archaeon]|nr:GNAT family N-acetyltransferase [Candidatus Micrarchaeota archaeon]